MKSDPKSAWQFRIDVFSSAVCGIAFAVIAIVALAQMVLGDFSVTVHFCRRYGVHAQSIHGAALMMGVILGPALISRAVSLLRRPPKRHSKCLESARAPRTRSQEGGTH